MLKEQSISKYKIGDKLYQYAVLNYDESKWKIMVDTIDIVDIEYVLDDFVLHCDYENGFTSVLESMINNESDYLIYVTNYIVDDLNHVLDVFKRFIKNLKIKYENDLRDLNNLIENIEI